MTTSSTKLGKRSRVEKKTFYLRPVKVFYLYIGCFLLPTIFGGELLKRRLKFTGKLEIIFA
jgi:hypothetical protein